MLGASFEAGQIAYGISSGTFSSSSTWLMSKKYILSQKKFAFRYTSAHRSPRLPSITD